METQLLRLDGKTALVTGGGSGIGNAIASLFARQGAHVVLLEIDEQKGNEAASAIVRDGGSAEAFSCDVSDQTQVRGAIDTISETRGPLNILVNNAGIAHVGNVLQTEEEDFDRLYRVNVKGVYNCLRAGVERMVANGGGAILNLASTASVIGIPDRFAYSTTKGAVLTMTYSVATDFIDKGIRCNCICPARIHTPFVDGFVRKNYPGREEEMLEKLARDQPIGRMGKPEEVATLALYLCSDEAAFVTGQAYLIDGGLITTR